MSPDCAFYTFAVEQVELCLIMSCCVLQTMTDVVGNPEEERRAEFYYQPWAQEAVCRYFYSKVIDSLSNFCIVSFALWIQHHHTSLFSPEVVGTVA